MVLVCASVVGRANNPLYFRSLLPGGDAEILKFQYIVHCALDAVEEKVTSPQRRSGDAVESYLGLLYPTEDYRVYGYISNTRIKLMLIVDDHVARDDEMRQVFKKFHQAYVDAASNPFYTANTPLTSKRFDSTVTAKLTPRT
ncbi:hypothetical protein WJX84_004759 [Apatococcus fuscideae]|uniref:Trafficking protein particle complex subunit 2-like protein n=1 Tax=Apatococcus fuscideae TaxID=2026836 RepID=A0AAW1T4E0_9CHLO